MIKLLVVDDSALVRKLVGQVFAAQDDFELAFARNGLEALEQLTAFAPDVITLDVQMPQMDGLACLDAIMLQRPTPVVMVSSLTQEGAETSLEALRLGAVDFAAKPNGPVSLHLEEWGPELVAKVRAASRARLRSSLRLKERIRHRIGGIATARRPTTERGPAAPQAAVNGQGLVLVGTSTGGPPALETMLTSLPGDFPWPILVAQHMPASFTGPLASRLNKLCALTVVEVAAPVLIEPGVVYIGRGDADLVVERRAVGLTAISAPPEIHPWHPSTDRLVRTAMDALPPAQLIGVLMTGMGDDGAQAMTVLRRAGGRTIAESEETAVVWGMPGELVKAGGADWITPLPGIAARLCALTPACP